MNFFTNTEINDANSKFYNMNLLIIDLQQNYANQIIVYNITV